MPRPNWIMTFFGVLTAAIGTLPLLAAVGVLPSRPPAPGDAPAWVGAAIGLAFFLAGIFAILHSLAGADDSSSELTGTAPVALRAFNDLMRTAIVVLLALLMSWVAFGPGDRAFTISAGGVGAAMAVHASGGGQIIGRIAFGVVAIVSWLMVANMMAFMARRWFPRR